MKQRYVTTETVTDAERLAIIAAQQWFGIERVKTRVQDVVTLPGTLMPQMFNPLRVDGQDPVDRYDLSESYRLTLESYHDEEYEIAPANVKTGLKQVGVRAVSLFDRARNHASFQPHPPGTPGFWDWYHFCHRVVLHNSRGDRRVSLGRRLCRGALRYALVNKHGLAAQEIAGILSDMDNEGEEK